MGDAQNDKILGTRSSKVVIFFGLRAQWAVYVVHTLHYLIAVPYGNTVPPTMAWLLGAYLQKMFFDLVLLYKNRL